jgi:hypothetical protein
MDDPFFALKEAFSSMSNGIEPYDSFEIQQLNKAIQCYDPNKPKTFFELIKAVGGALSYFEELGIDFAPIKNAADALAQIHIKSDVKWNILLSPTSKTRFQENTPGLIPWLNAVSGVAFNGQSSSEKTRLLIEHSEDLGFSQKLGVHLKEEPEFLLRLILDAEKNFNKIANSRLIFYLTDEQIAQAIIHYAPKLNINEEHALMQVKQFIDKLNGVLSHGRSFSTILHSGDAQKILDSTELLKIYLSDQYKTIGEEQPSFSQEAESLKLRL